MKTPITDRESVLPDSHVVPTMSVEHAGQAAFQFGRSKSYDEARRYLATDGAEGLPVIRFGSLAEFVRGRAKSTVSQAR